VPIYALTIIIAAAGLAGGYWWVMSGFRNGGRPGDARLRVHRLRVPAAGWTARGRQQDLSPCLRP